MKVKDKKEIVYMNVRNELIKLTDAKLADFNKKITPDINWEMLGIKTPVLRSFAKELLREYGLDKTLSMIQNKYYEEIMLEGLVTAYAKLPLNAKFEYIKKFVPKIDNWAVCDTFVPTFKFKENDLNRVWEFILPYINSDKEFEIRFAVVMILDYFIIPEYVDEVIKILNRINHEGYYVKMAVAWTLCEIGVKFNDKFMKYFMKTNLDKFTYNKTISKMCDSFRIADEQKQLLRTMRIK